MKHVAIWGTFLMFLSTACQQRGESKLSPLVVPELKAEEVERVYQLYLRGNYSAYVDEMLSCDSMPHSYRQQICDLHKMHAHQQKMKNGGAIAGRVVRIENLKGERQATAFLYVNYRDKTHEVIRLSMVYDGNRWRLK